MSVTGGYGPAGYAPDVSYPMGVKIVDGVDKSGFVKAAQPVQDQLAAELGPHAVKLLKMVRDVK